MKWISRAFSCPLEAGNAVYRARSVLRTQGDYTFDDTANCETRKEENGKSDEGNGDGGGKFLSNDTEITEGTWRIYPNPAQHRLWITSEQMETLESIQLFNSIGLAVLSQAYHGKDQMEVLLPTHLAAGLYFLRLELSSGEIRIEKILLQP